VSEHASSTPTFSIVSAVYNVARYLPDFIATIEGQDYDLSKVQVVMVNDGSTDDSLELIEQWRSRAPGLVTVIDQPNAGQSAARNAGLAVASGTWITFTDPDDTLDSNYLSQVAAALDQDPRIAMAAVQIVNVWESRNIVADDHPLRKKFRGGDKVVDLDRFPEYIQLSAASAFFKGDSLRALNLTFDHRVVPNFEDAHLIARYLLEQDQPLLAIVSSTRYLYRRRGDGTSTLQGASRNPGRYTHVLRYGLLDLLERGAQRPAGLPLWVQNLAIYESSWTLRAEHAIHSRPSAATTGVADEFHDLMSKVTQYLTPDAINQYAITHLSRQQRLVYAHGWARTPWAQEWALVDQFDALKGLVRIRYYYHGAAPDEEVLFRGLPLAPTHHKVRDITYSGRALLHERILWVPAEGTLRLRLNGHLVPLHRREPPRGDYLMTPSKLRRSFASSPDATEPAARRRGAVLSPFARRRELVRARRQQRESQRFAAAWVFMDRTTNASDNAEHLFRYVRRKRKDINAWFVILDSSPDWVRLRNEFGDRVVAYGSPRWVTLCLAADHMVSSHADLFVYNPTELRQHGEPQWRFTFLQHGVIKDDLSRWLNPKPITTFVTSTTAEFGSVAGSGSPYTFTTNEVVRTGLPRHDRLLRLRRAGAKQSLILVMPTWRQWLTEHSDASGGKQLHSAATASDFVRHWREFLLSPELAAAAADAGAQVVVFAHPNLLRLLAALEWPSHLEFRNYTDHDVQQSLIDALVVVTDYSSVVFDAALIERPITYFQFDRHEVFGGGHVSHPGYFSYDRDGFGPVALTATEAVVDVCKALEQRGIPVDPYATRMREAFADVADGRSCKRVIAAIEDGTRRSRRTVVEPPLAPPIEIPHLHGP
jgi:hypothetical protein